MRAPELFCRPFSLSCPSDPTSQPKDYAMNSQQFGAGQTPSNYAGVMYGDRFYNIPQRNWGMMAYWSDGQTFPYLAPPNPPQAAAT